MDLQSLMVDSKSAWVDFDGLDGFKVEIATLSRKEFNSIRKSCTVHKFDRKTKVAVEELNEDKFIDQFAKAAVKNWSGLTLKHLETLILIDTTDKDMESELGYSEENARLLLSNSSEFDNWLNELVFDLNSFRS